MAAFENISETNVASHHQLPIDIRTVELPLTRRNTEYDPRKHRTPRPPIKLWMAYFNLLRSAFGPGVLGLPFAVSQTGYVLGPILALSFGLLVVHTHGMLLNTLNEISRQLGIPYVSYRYGFRIAVLHGPPCFQCLGYHGPSLIALFMVMSQIGICTVFVTFTADSVRDIMDWQSVKPALLTLLFPYLILLYFMKSLHRMSYVSMLGNVLNFIALILVVILVFKDKHDHGQMKISTDDPIQILLAIGTLLFNSSVLGVILSIDKALEEPTLLVKRFGLMHVGMVVPLLLGTIFGILGYWSFGVMHENLVRSLPYDDSITMLALGAYLVAVAFAFPIQCFPGIQIMIEVIKNQEHLYPPSAETLLIFEHILRPLFVLTVFFISYLLPFQAAFVAFVGNLCTTMLALVFPAIMEICVMYPGPFGRFRIYLIKDTLIMLLGLACRFFGVALVGYLLYVRWKLAAI